ncbi:hypothetical protein [Streptomyces melanogenes]|uniref:hypothetical protein n=1 Tax=Streptomyces melanogenes TaxID=67326 RepID=UPI00167C9659|nr:hypothetical protein [Streptomyces melanogenes]GGP82608.1 hypothetical protein GCM10010278_71590 [Streptomyces melanogenes]
MPEHEHKPDSPPRTPHIPLREAASARLPETALAMTAHDAPNFVTHPPGPGMHVLQRAAGNGGVAKALAARRSASTRGAPTPPTVQRAGADSTDAGPSDAVTYRLHIQVKKQRRMVDPQYWDGNDIGHAWVVLYTKSGGSTSYKSYGFFPSSPLDGRREALSTVPGVVKRNWDLPEGATSAFEAELTQEQVLKFKEYIDQHESEKYSLFRYNCVSFARGAFKAATGKSAPGLDLPLLENPNLLQDFIKRTNEKQGKPRAGERVADAYAGDPSPTRSERMALEAANAAGSDSGGEWVPGHESPASAANSPAHPPQQHTPGRMLLESDSDSDESARGRPTAPPTQPAQRRFSLD